jgi:hypothetical protein
MRRQIQLFIFNVLNYLQQQVSTLESHNQVKYVKI